MILDFVFVGKKNSLYQDIENIYSRRLSQWFKSQIIYFPDSPSQHSKRSDLQLYLKKYDVIWICDERGQLGSSLEWQKWTEKVYTSCAKRWCICIGGAWGITSEVRQTAHQSVNLAPFTLPHYMARIIVMEQIYRSMTLIFNHPYHK